ncbi:hypothetical protein QUB80_05295 [Chlorogloeopsis sp. ULAP01]|uniref:hypothetical protein n=1 Tax=Chlorogloeopsis sp. ULAP01 TaxID=3056483 RepID=UPI0025AB0030|nr:hypothetical protein [Chlorogloeopsis sp. ULAP01]MDM9380113.1 hypothetical protein [Chlorogloeopsis sp. ULAP01]
MEPQLDWKVSALNAENARELSMIGELWLFYLTTTVVSANYNKVGCVLAVKLLKSVSTLESQRS